MKFFLSLLVLTLCSFHISAQSEDTFIKDSIYVLNDTLVYQTNEVIVTGTRVEKKIIDIPYSVLRIDNSQFRFERNTSVSDVLGFVPGMFLQSRYGNHDVRISIRGFGSRSNSGIRGVRILLDGIPESEPDGQTRIEAIDFNSVGRIEVVKGNSSSLYTNAPGGVVNFINDIEFDRTFFVNFNEFGSFGLRRNGIKSAIKTDKYRFLTTYSYHNYKGFRDHSEDYWHILNTVLETTPDEQSKLQVLGYFVNGLIRLPGSLTKAEFEEDPFQAAQREVDFDYRRISKKGRIGLRFNTSWGDSLNNDIEITGYGTIKYFERTSRIYRIINRYGLGASMRYIHRNTIFDQDNEFSVGGDLLYQTGPIEYYNNISGAKGDDLAQSIDGTIGNSGFYLQNSLELYDKKLYMLLTGRYDYVYFDQQRLDLQVQSSKRTFDAFTPKAALNYKFTEYLSVYSSFGFSFDSPAGNELDNYPLSSEPGKLLNPDLEPQKSTNFEIGMKGNLIFPRADLFRYILFEATFFNTVIDDEIVPFEVFGDVFFRNSAQTTRRGLELGGEVEIIKGLKFVLSYTYSDFSYDSYNAETIELDSTGNIVTQVRDFSGNIVPSVPEHNFATALMYEHRVNNNLTYFVKGSIKSISGLYVDDFNTDRTDGYTTLNSLAGIDLKFGKLNFLLSAGVNNITDEVYVGFVNINSATQRFYEVGEPRTFFGGLNIGYQL